MASSHMTFGSTTYSAQSSSPSTATTGKWSVGVEGGNRGGKRGKGEHGRSAWSGGPPAAQPGQSQSPDFPSVSHYQGGSVFSARSAWARGPPAIQSGQSQSPPASAHQGASGSWSAGTDGGHEYSSWSGGPPVAQSGQSRSPPDSAAQGAGQDKAKGKGKGKKKRHKKSNSAGQSQVDNLHEKVQALKIEDGTEESSEEVCFICAEPVKYYSVSTCNHRTCHVCSLRLRALYKKLECTFCKEPQQSIVFTASPDKPYEMYDLGRMPHRDNELSIFFEKQEMMEATLILLRFNCPDPDCDHVGNGWEDLKLHTRTSHNRLICDLCVRNKKIFAHEHALYPPSLLPFHLPSMIQGHRQNAPKAQIEGGVHPMCEFCRECFFGDDELYAHCRERHEECFVCKRNDIRNKYFQDYNSLEQHFNEAHHPCTQSQCLARKFVVFGTLLDLKVHTVEEHGWEMSSRDRKDARRIVADFPLDDRHDHGRQDHQYYHERDQEREREREPLPVPRQFQATGQSRRREAFGARLTIDGESSILASQPAIELNRMLTPTNLAREYVDPALADRHGILIARLQWVASNPTTAIPAVNAAIRGYRLSESSARDLISTIWNILDRNLEHTASIVNAFVDLIEEEEKKQDLRESWSSFSNNQLGQFPELVPTAVGGSYAAIATGRVLNTKRSPTIAQKSPRAVWDRAAQVTSSSMSTQPPATSVASSNQSSILETFPPLSPALSSPSSPSFNRPAIRSPSQNQRTTPWISSGVSNLASYANTASYSMAASIQAVAPPPPASTVPRSPLSPTAPVSMSGVGVKHRRYSTANEIASWSTLLEPSSSTIPGSSVPSGRNILPTSNGVGISISPLAIASSASSINAVVSPRNKAELIALLTNGPSAVGNYASVAAAAANGERVMQKGKLKLRGLVNNGNMCFANSVLQMLVYTVPFQQLFSEIGKLRITGVVGLGNESTDGSASAPLVDAMVEFVKEFVVTDAESYEGNVGSGNATDVTVNGWGKGKEKEREREDGGEDEFWEGGELWETGDEDELWGTESFLPSYVYEAMTGKKRFNDMQQEDAEEFLGFLLETLEEELVSLKETLTGTSSSSPLEQQWPEIGKKKRTVVTRTIKSTESPITKIFGGKFRTTLKVPHKKKDSVIVEDWRSIRLDIQRDLIYTVEDALMYISQPQPVQVTNPARPGTTLEAHQVVHIDALPPVLVLHMKRFCYDMRVGDVVKEGKQVSFGPELEIGKDVLSHAIRKSQQPKYKLFGVLYHHGSSAFGGFYTLDVLHPTRFSSPDGRPREGWIRFYDELVSDVRHEDVFGGEKADNRCAYLLFYRRIQ